MTIVVMSVEALCAVCELPKLILCKATSAIDHRTDEMVQETLRTAFADRTVLTIAHRLETIMCSDRVLVLEQGALAEFDTPANLLARPDSMFKRVIEAAGVAH